jgi:hypothetical protein
MKATKKKEIMDYVYNSKTINNIFSSIIQNKDKRDLMKSDVYIMLCELDEKKLLIMYENGKIDGFIAKIILNQWNSNTSDYYKNWKNGGFRKSLTKDSSEFNTEPIEYVEQLSYSRYMNDVNTIIESTHWYHKTLFNLYFVDKHSYKEIEELTGINFRSVFNSVNKTLEHIRIELKNKYKDEL